MIIAYMPVFVLLILVYYTQIIGEKHSFNRHSTQVLVFGFESACITARIYLLESIISGTEIWKYKKE